MNFVIKTPIFRRNPQNVWEMRPSSKQLSST